MRQTVCSAVATAARRHECMQRPLVQQSSTTLRALQVATQALEIVEGLSGSPDGIATLRSAAEPLCRNLFRCARDVSLSRSALTCIVNLSQDATIARTLVDTGACTTLLDYLRESASAHPDLVVMALSNLTQSEAGASAALQVRRQPESMTRSVLSGYKCIVRCACIVVFLVVNQQEA